MSKKVIIIDYKLGNLFSVEQACKVVGINSLLSSCKDEILGADGLILPGVGAFNEAMKNIKDLGLEEIIKSKVENGTPLFGICLGLQLLFTKSEEFGEGYGLNLIPGVIKKFSYDSKNEKLKVPHISWNKIYNSNRNWENTPLSGINQNEYMYFVHSFYVNPLDLNCVLTKTNYGGIEFCSSIYHENIFATQFHPEKSASEGLSLYKKWGMLNNLI